MGHSPLGPEFWVELEWPLCPGSLIWKVRSALQKHSPHLWTILKSSKLCREYHKHKHPPVTDTNIYSQYVLCIYMYILYVYVYTCTVCTFIRTLSKLNWGFQFQKWGGCKSKSKYLPEDPYIVCPVSSVWNLNSISLQFSTFFPSNALLWSNPNFGIIILTSWRLHY